MDTHEELMSFKAEFRKDVLRKFGLENLQDYSDPQKIEAFRRIFEEFFENGQGIIKEGALNPLFLKRVEEARALFPESIPKAALNPRDKELLKDLGPKWDRFRDDMGRKRIELGDLRAKKLKEELEEFGLPSEQMQDVDCKALRTLSQGFPDSGKNCFAFTTKGKKDELEGKFCSCGNALNATNWLIRCPKKQNEFLDKSNYYDQLALFKNESINCFRVNIPDNATCFAGPAGPRRGGLGGMSQIFCPKRPGGDVRFSLKEKDLNHNSEVLATLEKTWNDLKIPPSWHLINDTNKKAILNGESSAFELGPDIKRHMQAWSPNPGDPKLSQIVHSVRECVKDPRCDKMVLEDYYEENILPMFADPIVKNNRVVDYALRQDADVYPDEWKAIRIYICQYLIKSMSNPHCNGLKAKDFPKIENLWHPQK